MDLTQAGILAARRRDHRRLLPPAGGPLERAAALVQRAGLVSVFAGYELPPLYRPDGSALTVSFETAWEVADRLSADRRAFYAKLFRGKATLAAPAMLPWLWAALRRDVEEEYAAGRLSRTAVAVYRHLRATGPLPADRLRREVGFRGGEALGELEGILAIAVVDRVRVNWDTFVWGLAEDWLPAGEAADFDRIAPALATRQLLLACLERAGAAPLADIDRWFTWRQAEVRRAVEDLAGLGRLRVLPVEGLRGPCALLSA